MFMITSRYYVPSTNLGRCFPSCICKRVSSIDPSEGTSSMHLKKGRIFKTAHLQLKKYWSEFPNFLTW
jgi:hypothetical protein